MLSAIGSVIVYHKHQISSRLYTSRQGKGQTVNWIALSYLKSIRSRVSYPTIHYPRHQDDEIGTAQEKKLNLAGSYGRYVACTARLRADRRSCSCPSAARR